MLGCKAPAPALYTARPAHAATQLNKVTEQADASIKKPGRPIAGPPGSDRLKA